MTATELGQLSLQCFDGGIIYFYQFRLQTLGRHHRNLQSVLRPNILPQSLRHRPIAQRYRLIRQLRNNWSMALRDRATFPAPMLAATTDRVGRSADRVAGCAIDRCV